MMSVTSQVKSSQFKPSPVQAGLSRSLDAAHGDAVVVAVPSFSANLTSPKPLAQPNHRPSEHCIQYRLFFL